MASEISAKLPGARAALHPHKTTVRRKLKRAGRKDMSKVLSAETQAAYDDICSRTLRRIPCMLERLIYIASTRDYNSGVHHHEGLAARFNHSAAAQALEAAHLDTFYGISRLSLSELCDQLEQYIASSREDSAAFLNAWQKLEPYRVAIPMHADPIITELFVSNITLALAVVRHRLPQKAARPSPASPRPSPAPQSLLRSHS